MGYTRNGIGTVNGIQQLRRGVIDMKTAKIQFFIFADLET